MDVFDQNCKEYDQWFDDHPVWFQSELNALGKVVPPNGFGLEIGIGTGRFAEKCGIDRGIDPSGNMARIAEQRGVKSFLAKAENMPFLSDTFDFAVMITTVCFLDDILQAFRETARVLKPNGHFIIGMIDKDSPLGQKYQQNKEDNPFYRDAHFHSVTEITELLENTGFGDFEYWQTLITASEEEPEEPQPGYGEGCFVVIKALLH
ncbi:class I SAM-dependent methyltransferase [Rhodohalobacter sp. 8-1]|uniref:class I SAM-dependent methyltransferase n=1 Tax=Rhodohalobacter sp. 8-1 TaxID=3131972 RepID=UPI0030ECE931